MYYPLTPDYIKFLNDPDCNKLNYDQWKDRKMRMGKEKSKKDVKKAPFSSRY